MSEILIVILVIAALLFLARQAILWKRERTRLSLDDVRRNPVETCMFCRGRITEDNDSGWCGFVAPGVVQKICTTCHAEMANITEKAKDGDA
jgi:hypothetical protein